MLQVEFCGDNRLRVWHLQAYLPTMKVGRILAVPVGYEGRLLGGYLVGAKRFQGVKHLERIFDVAKRR
jgi:hypothetical protein